MSVAWGGSVTGDHISGVVAHTWTGQCKPFLAFFLFRKESTASPPPPGRPDRTSWWNPFCDTPVSIHSLWKLASAVKLFLKDVSDLIVHYFHSSLHKRTFRKALGEERRCIGLL